MNTCQQCIHRKTNGVWIYCGAGKRCPDAPLGYAFATQIELAKDACGEFREAEE